MRCGRRSGAASVAVQVHDLAFKARALHVGLERRIDPRRGFAQVRPCLQGHLDARLIQCAFATGLAGSSTPAVKSVCASSGTVESRTAMPTIFGRCARCNDLR